MVEQPAVQPYNRRRRDQNLHAWYVKRTEELAHRFWGGGGPLGRFFLRPRMLGEIGVRVTFNQVESVVLTSSRLEKSFKHAIAGTSSTGYDPVKVIRDFMLVNSPKNYGSISDPVMTDLVERVTYTTDFDERGRLLKQIHERYLDQVYSIDFYSNTYMFVRQPWLHNVAYAVEGYFLAFGSSQLAHAWIDDRAPGDRAGRLKA